MSKSPRFGMVLALSGGELQAPRFCTSIHESEGGHWWPLCYKDSDFVAFTTGQGARFKPMKHSNVLGVVRTAKQLAIAEKLSSLQETSEVDDGRKALFACMAGEDNIPVVIKRGRKRLRSNDALPDLGHDIEVQVPVLPGAHEVVKVTVKTEMSDNISILVTDASLFWLWSYVQAEMQAEEVVRRGRLACDNTHNTDRKGISWREDRHCWVVNFKDGGIWKQKSFVVDVKSSTLGLEEGRGARLREAEEFLDRLKGRDASGTDASD